MKSEYLSLYDFAKKEFISTYLYPLVLDLVHITLNGLSLYFSS